MVAMYGGTISAKRKALQNQISKQPLNYEQLCEVRNDRRNTDYLLAPKGGPQLKREKSRTTREYEDLVH